MLQMILILNLFFLKHLAYVFHCLNFLY
uniref:Uncharacterized protein n=1 Tax=Rhizophora mucronata TaxID=61149 RepID=A0A2P2NE35_RHIMU